MPRGQCPQVTSSRKRVSTRPGDGRPGASEARGAVTGPFGSAVAERGYHRRFIVTEGVELPQYREVIQ